MDVAIYDLKQNLLRPKVCTNLTGKALKEEAMGNYKKALAVANALLME